MKPKLILLSALTFVVGVAFAKLSGVIELGSLPVLRRVIFHVNETSARAAGADQHGRDSHPET
jgi:hypothetical protein